MNDPVQPNNDPEDLRPDVDLNADPNTDHFVDPFAGPTPPELVGLSPAHQSDLARAKRAAVLVGLIVPLVLVAVYTVVLVTWLPRLPNPIATHWSGSGAPDGFSSHAGFILFASGMSAGMALLMGCIAVFGSGKGEIAVWSGMNRFMAAFSLMMSVSIGLMGVLLAQSQLGLDDAQHAGEVGSSVAIAFGVGIVAGALGFVLQPKVHIEGATKRAAQALVLAPTERAVWLGAARPQTVFVVAIGVTMVSMILGTGATWAAGVGGDADAMLAFWIMLATTLLVGLVLAVTFSFRVRIDVDGLEARSAIGWPVFRVPSEDIERAVATRISPLAEFGGWGIRWMPGRLGLVLRTGEGLVVTRKDGRIFAVTIDDAATAAGLLQAYAHPPHTSGEQA